LGSLWPIVVVFIPQVLNSKLLINDNDNDNDKPIKSLLKGKGLLPLVGLAQLDS
jgi:hypothetical protein